MLLRLLGLSAGLPAAAAASALAHAAYWGWLKDAKQLVAQGAELEDRDWLGKTPLAYAVWQGHAQVAQYLMKEGADVKARDDYGETPLALAARYGHVHCLKLLIVHRADVHTAIEDGKTPLALAAMQGHGEMVDDLINAGAEVDAPDRYGQGPVGLAAKYGSLPTTERLVHHGARLNAESKSGQTPLSFAAASGHLQVVRYLLQHHAAVDVKDGMDATPLVLAAQGGHAEVSEELRAAGARVDPWDEVPSTGLPLWAQVGRDDARRYGLPELTLLWRMQVAVASWETYVAVLGGLLLATLLATVDGRLPRAPPSTDAERIWIPGAKLLPRGVCLRCFRLAEVWVNAVGTFSWPLLVVWWPYWLALAVPAFLLTACRDFSIATLLSRPALIFAARGNAGAAGAVLRLAILVAVVALAADTFDETVLLGAVPHLGAQARQGILDALADAQRAGTSEGFGAMNDAVGPLDALHNRLNRQLISRVVGYFPRQKLGPLDLLTVFAGFQIVTLISAASYFMLLIGHLLKAACWRSHGSHEEEVGCELRQPPEGVGLKLCLLVLDSLLHFAAIWTLLFSRSFFSAFLLTTFTSCSWLRIPLHGEMWQIRVYMSESLRRGTLHPKLLQLRGSHLGCRVPLCLVVMAQSFFFSALDVTGALILLLSMAVSAYGASSFIYEQIDLEVCEELPEPGGEPHCLRDIGKAARSESEESFSMELLLNVEKRRLNDDEITPRSSSEQPCLRCDGPAATGSNKIMQGPRSLPRATMESI